jgi:hypothetical protein
MDLSAPISLAFSTSRYKAHTTILSTDTRHTFTDPRVVSSKLVLYKTFGLTLDIQAEHAYSHASEMYVTLLGFLLIHIQN